MNIYHQKYFYFALAFLFSGCVIMNEPEVKVVGPVSYSHQVSKKEIEYEPDALVPESTISVAKLNYNATTQIIYTKNSVYKKHKGEYYFYSNSKVDTLLLNVPDSTFVPTDYFLFGNFKPPVSQFSNWRFEDRGVKFSLDGFCVHTTEGSGSDTPMTTTTQVKGIYRTKGDTIYISNFMTKSLYGGGYYPYDSTVKSIDDISWAIREPYEQIYLLSQTNDTLYDVTKSNYRETEYYLLGSDSLTRIQR